MLKQPKTIIYYETTYWTNFKTK